MTPKFSQRSAPLDPGEVAEHPGRDGRDPDQMTPIVIGYILTGIVSAAMLVVAWRSPNVGRYLYGALFLAAGIFNLITAIHSPEVYITGFAPHAFPPMDAFIERVVALAPDAIVGTIAVGQMAIAVALAVGKGFWFWAGVVGAASFLVAISWLGSGAAFPMNLVMAAGAGFLLAPKTS